MPPDPDPFLWLIFLIYTIITDDFMQTIVILNATTATEVNAFVFID